MKSINLKNAAIIVSTTLVIVSMMANFFVYQSLSSGVDSFVFAIIGISFDSLKLVIIIMAGILWARGHAWMAVIAGLFFICLSLVSVFSAFGFSANSIEKVETAKAAASEQVNRKREQLDQTTEQINALANVAAYNIATLKMSYAELEEKKATEQITLSTCPPNYKTNCIKPAQKRIDALSTQIQPLAVKIQQYERYNGLLVHKKELDSEYSALLSSGGIAAAVSPIFSIPAKVLKIDPIKIKFYFLSLSSLILELGSSFLVLCTAVIFSTKPTLSSANTAQQEHNITPTDLPKQENQQGNGDLLKKPFTSITPTTEAMLFNKPVTWHTTALSLPVQESQQLKQKPVKPAAQGAKNNGVKYDSGVTGDNASRYKRIKKAVSLGKVKPSIPQIKEKAACNAEIAKQYLQAMFNDGILKRLENGQYRLATS